VRISLLLEREPFGEIVEQTLPDLLLAVAGKAHVVHWYPSATASRRRTRDEQLWLCNVYLNAIFRPTVGRAALEPVRREYARSTVWWRRPLQRAYVAAATRGPSAAWLAGPRVGITPPLAHADDVVILGGNHRLRVLDRHLGVSHVIVKAGRDPSFMRAELELRRRTNDLPVPRVVRAGAGERWFTEELVVGTPLNRLPLRSRHWPFEVARAALECLVRRTLQDVVAHEYAKARLSAVEQVLLNPRLHDVESCAIREVARELASVVRHSPPDTRVATAQTHGDFQPANILAGGDRVWLIDWEYTARRQAGFDALTYVLGSRLGDGFAARVGLALGDRLGVDVLQRWPGLCWDTPAGRRRTLALFLLEELELRARENTSALFRRPTPGTATFLRNVEAATRDLCAAAA